jgi:hypothetical protein
VADVIAEDIYLAVASLLVCISLPSEYHFLIPFLVSRAFSEKSAIGSPQLEILTTGKSKCEKAKVDYELLCDSSVTKVD